jgi:cell division protease FtsH
MVCEWGMSKKLGPISYGQKEEPIFIGKEIARHKDYSEETAQEIDNEIKKIIEECLVKSDNILKENREKLDLLANTLVEKETLDDKEIQALLKIKPLSKNDNSMND